MTTAKIQTSFATGEISPTLWGRTDLAKFHVGAATIRNMYVDYRGGVSSRGGLQFIGASKTSGSSLPPRLIPFTFNIQQGQTYVLEFGDKYIRFIQNGAYITETAKLISGVTNASPCVITSVAHGFSSGDWVIFSGVTGATLLNGKTAVVNVLTADTFALLDTFGTAINSSTYGTFTGVGSVSRIYTISSPYAIADLPYLKYDQSADVMTLVHTSYPPYDLKRLAGNSWTMTKESFATVINPPSTITAWANTTTTGASQTQYTYVVTAIDSTTQQESVASHEAIITNSVNIATTAGSNTVQWSAVTGASSYRVYKAPASYNQGIPQGQQVGYMASTTGLSTIDTNIIPDYTSSPPTHQNPFATSSINYITVTNGGSGYTQGSTTAAISSSTGSGAILRVVVGTTGATSGIPSGAATATGSVQSVVVVNGGEGYKSTDTVVITDTGAGVNATASMTVNPATGTWPGVVSYFQQRRVYAATGNQPNTYFMSRPGSFLNFDKSFPTTGGDAIEGTPWSKQINGVSWLVPMPGGMVVLAGLGAWQVSGGASGAAITPASQNAQPQAYNGVSPTVPPIVINYDIIYLQQKGYQVLDLSYNFFTNIYTGVDITIMSNHLFTKPIKEWCWAQSPHKLVWAVKSDGSLLSLTYLKEQEVQGWSHHDTNGLFKSVATVSEGLNDGVYFVVQRFIRGQWVYYIERINDRNWENIDDVFAVDCGLTNTINKPNGNLSASASSGTGVIFTSSGAVFSAANVGDVIRVGGGIATVTAFNSAYQVLGTVTSNIINTITDDPNSKPSPADSGDWSISTPISTIHGLDHLEGMTVSIVGDGSVFPNQVVTNGSVSISPSSASVIVVGLPFIAQLQSLYTDVEGAATIQGKRKNIPGVTVRVHKSRGFKVGSNQVDPSTQTVSTPTAWNSLVEIKDRSSSIYAGNAIPLYTGDKFLRINPTWKKPGQVSVQQDYPMPLTISALIPEILVGDDNG
jgi:hypothetical protein